jgi:hypothetical protein
MLLRAAVGQTRQLLGEKRGVWSFWWHRLRLRPTRLLIIRADPFIRARPSEVLILQTSKGEGASSGGGKNGRLSPSSLAHNRYV